MEIYLYGIPVPCTKACLFEIELSAIRLSQAVVWT